MANELVGKKILLVDDDRDIVESLRAALSDSGADVDAASDGNEALEKVEAGVAANKFRPDLMVLDMMMPKRSGFLVLESLKKTQKPADSPKVIVITGNPGVRHRVYAESLGVELYMTTPFRMDRLLKAITELLS